MNLFIACVIARGRGTQVAIPAAILSIRVIGKGCCPRAAPRHRAAAEPPGPAAILSRPGVKPHAVRAGAGTKQMA